MEQVNECIYNQIPTQDKNGYNNKIKTGYIESVYGRKTNIWMTIWRKKWTNGKLNVGKEWMVERVN